MSAAHYSSGGAMSVVWGRWVPQLWVWKLVTNGAYPIGIFHTT